MKFLLCSFVALASLYVAFCSDGHRGKLNAGLRAYNRPTKFSPLKALLKVRCMVKRNIAAVDAIAEGKTALEVPFTSCLHIKNTEYVKPQALLKEILGLIGTVLDKAVAVLKEEGYYPDYDENEDEAYYNGKVDWYAILDKLDEQIEVNAKTVTGLLEKQGGKKKPAHDEVQEDNYYTKNPSLEKRFDEICFKINRNLVIILAAV